MSGGKSHCKVCSQLKFTKFANLELWNGNLNKEVSAKKSGGWVVGCMSGGKSCFEDCFHNQKQ